MISKFQCEKKIMLLAVQIFIALLINAQNVGIGTTSPTQKLDVVGNVRVSGAIMPGGAPGNAGQVLVSSGNNLAPTWQNMETTTGGKLGISISSNSNAVGRIGFSTNSGDASQTDSIDIGAIYFNTGGDFSCVNTGTDGNYITVNSTGIYHFEGMVRFFLTHASVAILPRAAILFKYDPPSQAPIFTYIREEKLDQTDNTAIGNAFRYNLGLFFSFDFYLEAGTTFTFMTEFSGLTNYPLSLIGVSAGGYIGMYKISD